MKADGITAGARRKLGNTALTLDTLGFGCAPLGNLYHALSERDASALLIDATVLVQAAPTVEETAYLLSLAGEGDFIAGVVGWVDMTRPRGRGGAEDSYRSRRQTADRRRRVGTLGRRHGAYRQRRRGVLQVSVHSRVSGNDNQEGH